jgi:glycerol-3-phosphate dehydrogenase (NAD(P)+)
MAVAGPCIAGELAALRDTSVVIAGEDDALVERTIALLGAPFYHARACADVIGVEICAAFKNFFAIGVGWSAGALERNGPALNGAFMHNVSAGLFTQALTELGLLVEAFGGEASTAMGLAGVGDLYVTCLAGRNSRLGRWLGLGLTYSEAKATHMPSETIEGADLARAASPVLEDAWRQDRLPAERMPLARAIVDAICRDRPLTLEWAAFHRTTPLRVAAA